jgi:hypothetical protein
MITPDKYATDTTHVHVVETRLDFRKCAVVGDVLVDLHLALQVI